MARKVNIRPTSGVYATYKRLSYQPWTAIAEFVDNSTQSFYDHKDELMSVKYSEGLIITIDYIEDNEYGDRLEILDNAYGMEWSDFQRAIILDRPPINTNGRNEFGMGLKTSACWFGSLWSIESTQLNSKNKYYVEIDIDNLGKYKTEEIDVREESVSYKDHYTKIVISKLNKKIRGPRTVGKVKELLSSIYRVDIRSGLVKIYYNGTLLQFKEAPIYRENIDGQDVEWKKDISFSLEHEGTSLFVDGFIAIRIPGNVKEAGFTLLRRGRVIVGGAEKNYRPTEIFGDSNSFASQRLYGELNMDNWPVTQAKDSFDWHSSGLEETFIEKLEPLTQEYRRKAESIRVREIIDARELVQAVIGGLSDSGIVNNVDVEIIETPKQDDTPPIPDCINNANPSLSNQNNIIASQTDETIGIGDDGAIIKGSNQFNYRFRYKGNNYNFHIILDTSNPKLHWILVEDMSQTEYILTINMKHTFFRPLIEKREFLPIMAKMSIALVLAEIESLLFSSNGMIHPSDIRLKMNEILENVRKGEDSNGK